jgi:predicted nucleic acid-binding protein
VIYLDTSAILKLLRREPETEALLDHLDAHADQDLVTSALATVETSRALVAVGQIELAKRAVPSSDRVEIGDGVIPAIAVNAEVLDRARFLPPPVLRSLDAIHVATACLASAGLDHLVTYDKRMLVAAEAAGIPSVSPS